MIGRDNWPAGFRDADSGYRGYDLIRWAMRCTATHHLSQLDAHVLLVLSIKANTTDPAKTEAWGTSFATISAIATAVGLKAQKDGSNAAISRAIRRLEDAGLVWSKPGGRGRATRRELLYNATADASSHIAGDTNSHIPGDTGSTCRSSQSTSSLREEDLPRDDLSQGIGHSHISSDMASGTGSERSAGPVDDHLDQLVAESLVQAGVATIPIATPLTDAEDQEAA